MNITKILKGDDSPSRTQLDRISESANQPIVPDGESPAYTFEQLTKLFEQSRKKSTKKPVGLRLRQETIETYKSLGKGYTSVMAAVLEYSARHPEILKEALPRR